MSRKDADKYFLSHNLEIYEMCLQKFVFWENSNEKESKEKLKRIFSKRIMSFLEVEVCVVSWCNL